MGNDLRYIAQYCDCLQTPWQPYQPSSQQSQTNNPSQKHSKNSTRSHENSGVHEDKHIIFDQPLRESTSDLKIHANSRVFDESQENLSQVGHKEKDGKGLDDMEVIDLEKIDPIIKHQAKKKIKNKNATQPLIIEQRHAPSTSRPEESYTDKIEDTLSNIFEQKNNKYFIDNDEAEFYKIGSKRSPQY